MKKTVERVAVILAIVLIAGCTSSDKSMTKGKRMADKLSIPDRTYCAGLADRSQTIYNAIAAGRMTKDNLESYSVSMSSDQLGNDMFPSWYIKNVAASIFKNDPKTPEELAAIGIIECAKAKLK